MNRNRGFVYRECIGPGERGLTLLEYLTARYRHSPAEEWIERIATGKVIVDGVAVSPGMELRPGQTVAWHRPPWQEPDAPLDFVTLHDDDHILAVSKPAGLPVLPGAGFLSNTLLNRVREISPGVSPLHRLGRWTSGVVLFGKTRLARHRLGESWRRGEVLKRYRALARGLPAQRSFVIDTPIGPVLHTRLGSVHAAAADGKPARTRVEVVSTGGDVFLADVFIETGRPHQIRIHLAAAGHPLVGDPLYAAGGRPVEGSTALPGDPGYRLHAAELRFVHPATGDDLTLICDPPCELRDGALS